MEATEGALLVGPEGAEAFAGAGGVEELTDNVAVDPLLVVLNLAVEFPVRELRPNDAHRGRGLGLIADALALVHHPGDLAALGLIADDRAGIHLPVGQRQIHVDELQQLEQGRGLGRADLLLAVLDLLARSDQGTHQHLGRQSDLPAIVAIDLLARLVGGRLILDFRRPNTGSESLEGLVRHLVHHQRRHASTVNLHSTHTAPDLSRTQSILTGTNLPERRSLG